MKRIVIIGNNGAGKSVFAAKLGEKLNLPVIHLDSYFHIPGWKKRSNEEWLKIHEDFIKMEKWIIDGTYRKTIDKRIEASDSVIFLDIPKHIAFYRMIKRRFIYRKSRRPDMPPYLKEQISFFLIRKNLTFSRKGILKTLEPYSKTKNIIILKNNKAIHDFLEGIRD